MQHVALGRTLRYWIDLMAVIIGACCGQALGAFNRIDSWGLGATLGMLLAVAGMAGAVLAWKRARQPIEGLESVPLPTDEPLAERVEAEDAPHRVLARARREEDLVRIELLAADLELCWRRLRLAAVGAVAGSMCAWVVTIGAPVGAGALAGTMAALTAAVLGWQIAGGGWRPEEIHRAVIGGIPASALAMAWLVGGGWLTLILGAVVVAAGWYWRALVAAWTEGWVQRPV
jgi:hypothetical protein